MSTMTVVVTYDLLERAFELVDINQPSQSMVRGGAAKVYSKAGEVQAAVSEAWLKLKSMIERCAAKGIEIVRSEVEMFVTYVETTSSELGAGAREFRERLLDKVHEMISTTFDLMLRSLRSEIVIGERRLALKKVDLVQKLLFSGSLKISLTSLCELAGGAELTVTGSYEFASPIQ